jgi:hypothetical protein
MDVGQLAVGVGMGLYGAAFFGFVEWHSRDDRRMRRMAESRWRFDRLLVRKGRRGRVMDEQWCEQWIRDQRRIVKWLFRPFAVLCFAICLGAIVAGVRAT